MRAGPNLSGSKAAERAAREARLAAALRENLRRRKEQAGHQPPTEDAPGGLSATPHSSKSGCRGADTAD
jgi:hypothetical protein